LFVFFFFAITLTTPPLFANLNFENFMSPIPNKENYPLGSAVRR